MKRAHLLLMTAAVAMSGCAGTPAAAPTVTVTAPGPTTTVTVTATPTPTPSPTPQAAKEAGVLAEQIKQASTQKIVRLTPETDPNTRLGRPGGPTSAAILYDAAGACTTLGTDCGATIEVYPTAAEAKARSEYILAILKGAPALGTEYHTLAGGALLRVSGKLTPAQASSYASAFEKAGA